MSLQDLPDLHDSSDLPNLSKTINNNVLTMFKSCIDRLKTFDELLSINEFASKYKNHMNIGINAIQFDVCVQMFESFIMSYPNKPIISIGSGNAIFEWYVWRKTGKKIICIDPNPLSFTINNGLTKPFIEPSYSKVDDILAKCPEYIGNSIVYIGWCIPNLSYDYQAIIKLEPLAFLALTGIINQENSISNKEQIISIAGGERFYEFLSEQKNSNEYTCIQSILKSIKYGSVEGYPHSWFLDIKLHWWQQSILCDHHNDYTHNFVSTMLHPDEMHYNMCSLWCEKFREYNRLKNNERDEVEYEISNLKTLILQINESLPPGLILLNQL